MKKKKSLPTAGEQRANPLHLGAIPTINTIPGTSLKGLETLTTAVRSLSLPYTVTERKNITHQAGDWLGWRGTLRGEG